ncbi:DNA replication terminus site-binding protein [Thalassotalea sp. PLHSN55]|uniref:DNA replication terminus site-binding protein n=1 Tax=Thalassotalea sp. PLHSN55 TaxID=3435888 RepID=UPI003F843E2C
MEHIHQEHLHQLQQYMNMLDERFHQLKSFLLTFDVVVQYDVYNVTREQNCYSCQKIPSLEDATETLSRLRVSDPSNTKEADLFPGYFQIAQQHYDKAVKFVDSVNQVKLTIRNFLKQHEKKTRINSNGIAQYTMNPLMFIGFPMVNTLQVYRKINIDQLNITKIAYMWQSAKRYDKLSVQAAQNIIARIKLAPCPIDVSRKTWLEDLDFGLRYLDNCPPDTIITRIQPNQPKPLIKMKMPGITNWHKFYASIPIILANESDAIIPVSTQLKDIEVTNKKIILPITNNWKNISSHAHLYVKNN